VKKQLSPKTLLAELAADAGLASVLSSTRHPPGHFIKKLSPEKREILSRLKSDDIKNACHKYQTRWK